MKLQRQELCGVLNSLKPGLASNEMIEQSTHFIFDHSRIYTFNDQIMINQKFDIGVKGTINGQTFLKVLQKIPDKTINMSTSDDALIIKGKNKEIGLKLMPTSIDVPFDVEGIEWFKLPKNFVEGLKFCAFSATKDITKGPLVCIQLKDDKLTSCDNYRLTVYQLDKKFTFSFLIPRTAAEHLIDYAPTLFSSTNEWLHFRNENNTTFSCRTTGEVYPDVQHLLDFKGNWIKFPADFKDAIERAGLLSTAEFDYERRIDIIIGDGKIECKGEGRDGWFKETADLQYKGDDISFTVHPTFLSEILSRVSKVKLGEDKLLFRSKSFQHVIALAE